MLLNKLESIEKRYTELETLISSSQIMTDKERYISLSKEFAELKIIVAKFKEYKKVRSEIENLKAMMKDKEVREMAESEIVELEKKEQLLATELEYLLLPRDPNDEKDIFIEIRAGSPGAAGAEYEKLWKVTFCAVRAAMMFSTCETARWLSRRLPAVFILSLARCNVEMRVGLN